MRTSIEFQSRQKELWGILLFHEYYRDSIAKGLEFVPTEQTLRLLGNYYLTLKPLPFGFILLQQSEKSEELLRSLPPKTRLTFFLRSSNPLFVNFTDIPFRREGEIFYYTNLIDRKVELPILEKTDVYYYFRNLNVGEIEKKSLHLEGHSTIPIRPKQFNLNLRSFEEFDGLESATFSEVEILDEAGEKHYRPGEDYKPAVEVYFRTELQNRVEIEKRKLRGQGKKESEIEEMEDKLKKQVVSFLEKRKSEVIPLDLRHVPDGKYTIKIGKQSKDFYLSNRADDRFFGVMDLFLSGPGEGPENLLIGPALEEGQGSGLCHVIDYRTRHTFWRYHFLNYKGSRILPVEVKDIESKYEFTPPEKNHLSFVGKDSHVVESKSAIPMMEIPNYEFWLTRSKGKRNIKDLKLPFASGDLIKPEKNGDERKIFSDIFVYL